MGVELLIHMMMMMLVMLMFINVAFAQNTTNTSVVALPGCEERCGSLVVPYPFGIGENCSAFPSLVIFCNTSFNPPKAFLLLNSTDYVSNLDSVEVVKVSVEAGTIHINYPITKDCINSTSSTPFLVLDWPFTFSNTENRFTAMGCDYLALLLSLTTNAINPGGYTPQTGVGGCIPTCDSYVEKDNNCFGSYCCQVQFPASLGVVQPSLSNDSSYYSGPECDQEPRLAIHLERSLFIYAWKIQILCVINLQIGRSHYCVCNASLISSRFTSPTCDIDHL